MRMIAAFLLVVLLCAACSNAEGERRLDERLSLRRRDKIPYGYDATVRLLPTLFPGARMVQESTAPYTWSGVGDSTTAVFVTGRFWPDEYEMGQLLRFVEEGNYVFLMANQISYDAGEALGLKSDDIRLEDDMGMGFSDSLYLRLAGPRFSDTSVYIYPGRKYEGYLTFADPDKCVVLGRNAEGKTNFVQFRKGKGRIFLHTAPLAFSNYFVLHKRNSAYFQQAVSVVPGGVQRVVWNEYFLDKKESDKDDDRPSFLSVLMKYKSFSWALLAALGTLLLYVLLEARRHQRHIPVFQPLRNESLDFVQTIGRLYHDRRDHTDMAQKMAQYFLDAVRSQYKLSTQTLDDSFVQALHAKSGFPVDGLQELMRYVQHAANGQPFNELQLQTFHQQLEKFYGHS